VRETTFQEREAKVEELLEERSAGINRVVRWVGEANPSLDALGLSPIQIAEAPPSLGAVLLALDSCGRTNLNYTGSSTRVHFCGLQHASNGIIPWTVW
jgi:hypothetical protein